MTDKKTKQEFERWIDAERPKVWYRSTRYNAWRLLESPNWNRNAFYVVDDKHAELRKLQIDEPDTEFQVYHTSTMEWETVEPVWELGRKYRVAPGKWYENPEMVGKPVWCKSYKNNRWELDIFIEYDENRCRPFNCFNGYRVEAKPVKPEDLYQGEYDE